MARHLAPFSCRQTIAEIVRRRSWGGVLPLGRHASISGSRSIHAPSVSIALSSFQEGQNARLHNRFKREQALAAVGKRAVIPPKMRRRLPRDFDRHLSKARHLIETFFAKLKQYRAIATRYDKTARNFLAGIHLVASAIWLN